MLSSLLQSSINSKGENLPSDQEQSKMASDQSRAMPDIIKSRSVSTGIRFMNTKLLFINNLFIEIPFDDMDSCRNNFEIQLDCNAIREYQKELAAPGIEGKNCIVVAPTGTGKTLVGCLIISASLKRHRGKKVIFLAYTTPLAMQQKQKLSHRIMGAKVMSLTGETSNALALSSLLKTHDIVVCTPQILLNDLTQKQTCLEEISLIVFDECHRCKGQSPYAGVMIEYMKKKLRQRVTQLPQIVGLTASPGAGESRKPDLHKTTEHLIKLAALMDSDVGYVTVKENIAELNQYTNKTEVSVVTIQGRTSGDSFQNLLFKYVTKLDSIVQEVTRKSTSHCYTDQGYINFLSECLQESKLRSKDPEMERGIRSILEHLQYYIKILHYYDNYEFEDSLSLRHRLRNPSPDTIIPVEKQLLELLQDFEKEAKGVCGTDNPKLLQLKELLLTSFQQQANTKAMIFVTEVESAYKMKEWIKRQPELKDIRPDVVTGQTHAHDSLSMSQSEQERNIKFFHEGKLNLLVATAVLEEGMDVPACNLVVRYQHVTNEISLVQSKGRARAVGSKCYAIIGKGTLKQFQEMQNVEKNHLVSIAIKYHLPSESEWLPRISELQQNLLKAVEISERNAAMQKSNDTSGVKLLCSTCDSFVCQGSDVYRNMGQYVVLSEDIKDRYITREHEKPKVKRDLHIRDRIHCKECDQRWGVITHWPLRKQTLPCLSCEKVAFEIEGQKKIFTKWKDVTFPVQDLDHAAH